jgi:hypothetical protein
MRFLINYSVPSYVQMNGDFTGSWDYTSNFTNNGTNFSLDLDLAANTWYHFEVIEDGNHAAQNVEFNRANPSHTVPATGWVNELTLHTDIAGTYTFTWDHLNDVLTITFPAFPTVVIKGADSFYGTDITLVPAANGLTASNTIDFVGHANDWFTFGVELNGVWTGDNDEFTRADYERAISGNQNMWFKIEDGTVDYVYTFTWTFASNTLTIGYPDQIPAPTCVTVRDNLQVDRYYTICLDKAVTTANGASFWNLIHRGVDVAYLEEAELPLVAGRPYIFQAEATELCVEYSGDAVAAGAYGALVGTLAAMDQSALDVAASAASSDIYLLFDNTLWLANGRSGNNLPANRAYIVYDELVYATPTPAPGRRVRAIPMQGKTTTGVESINAAETPVKTVIDGKMYILRGEHMFDATGRMVK